MNIVKSTRFEKLDREIKGRVYTDGVSRIMYATDASPYKETPAAVVVPEEVEDLKRIVAFAGEEKIPIIPRGAGTSLAGQVVGGGIVVDLSRHFSRILELNVQEKWVRVQPGIILNELNRLLKPHGLFFGPETSTASRCTLGGMLGNNSCGLHSVIYGSTRDHTLEVDAILSDGSEVVFKPLDNRELAEKCQGETLENRIYRGINEILSDPDNQREIREEFPDKDLPRKNTGYALDVLLDSLPFTTGTEKFNLCKLLAGSEGTLAFTTAIKLNLIPLPPKEKGVVCAHFHTLEEALKANVVALKHNPGAVELMDDQILKLTEGNILQKKNRFFVKGEPGAILIIEFARESREEILDLAGKVEEDMTAVGLGYHFPVIFGQEDIGRVWALRKSALGLLSNMPGDAKPVSVIEDTAVHPQVLPEYIAEFKTILESYGLSCVFHAHVGSGEIHMRPVLNLKDEGDVERFRAIALDTAKLVKKYRGSLSGEHGDGRLRGEFIPLIFGEKNYQVLKEIKRIWDPDAILNPGKIVDTPRMNTHLRYEPGRETREIETLFDFSATHGMVRAIEKCNGSGDCKNLETGGGTLCPSYQASLDEKQTTRARANIMREFMCNPETSDPFDHREIYEILGPCLSCKACKSECPSSVDMAKLKAEFLQHYYDVHGADFRSRLVANINRLNKLSSLVPSLYNFMVKNGLTSRLVKKVSGFAAEREIPRLYKTTLARWAGRNLHDLNLEIKTPVKTVCLFNDEFTNFNDAEIGIKTVRLLTKLKYKVLVSLQRESGRTWLSKGFTRKAKEIANANIELFQEMVSDDVPLVGLDPSAILCFRDEYLDLAGEGLKEPAAKLAESAFMIDEFLASEMEAGNIDRNAFTKEARHIRFHGHCHQKALTSTRPTAAILSFPENYEAEEIESGCCGMAGSFGFEKEHYQLSVKIGELKLLPEIRKTPARVLIAAPGTSCRQQIKDNTGRTAKHPVEILYEALV